MLPHCTAHCESTVLQTCFACCCACPVPARSAGARFILVVEKDAVFQSLVESRLHEQLPCILITGGGVHVVCCAQAVVGLHQGTPLCFKQHNRETTKVSWQAAACFALGSSTAALHVFLATYATAARMLAGRLVAVAAVDSACCCVLCCCLLLCRSWHA